MSSMLYIDHRKLTVYQIVQTVDTQTLAMRRSRMSHILSKHGTLMLGVDP